VRRPIGLHGEVGCLLATLRHGDIDTIRVMKRLLLAVNTTYHRRLPLYRPCPSTSAGSPHLYAASRRLSSTSYTSTPASTTAITSTPTTSRPICSGGTGGLQLDLSGIFPPIATPFDSKENVDFAKLDYNLQLWNDIPFTGRLCRLNGCLSLLS